MSSNLRQYLGRYVPISAWLPAYAREFLISVHILLANLRRSQGDNTTAAPKE